MITKTGLLFFAPCLFQLFLLSTSAADPVLDTKISIPYQRFVLKNGLTLLVHEDHIQVSYKVSYIQVSVLTIDTFRAVLLTLRSCHAEGETENLCEIVRIDTC